MNLDQKWDDFQVRATALDLEIKASAMLAEQVKKTTQFLTKNGIVLPPERLAYLNKTLDQQAAMNTRRNKLRTILQGVNLGVIGLRDNGTDFDIVAPPSINDDVLEQYRIDTNFGWLPIVIGVVLVAAAISWIALLRDENKELVRKHNRVLNVADKKLCANPTSQICKDWNIEKKSNRFEEERNFADKLLLQGDSLWTGVKKGTKWGLAIALPILALLLWNKIK